MDAHLLKTFSENLLNSLNNLPDTMFDFSFLAKNLCEYMHTFPS